MIEIMQMIIFTSGFFLGIRIIARYVFLEPRLKKKGMIIYCLMLICSLSVYFLYGENIVLLIFIYVFFPGASLFMSRNEKKIRGFFLVFPIIGVIIGILYPLNYMIKNTICSIKSWSGYKVLVDLSIFFLLIMFYFLGRGWRINVI